MSNTPSPPSPPSPPGLWELSHLMNAATAPALFAGVETPAAAPERSERPNQKKELAESPGEARWAKELLAAMQANRQEMEGQAFGYPPVHQGIALKTATAALIRQVRSLTPRELSAIVCHFRCLLSQSQLRAWYTEDCGMALIALLEHMAAQHIPSGTQNKHMRRQMRYDVLGLLEGVVCLCTALHEPVAVARCVPLLLGCGWLPGSATARLIKSAVVCLDTQYPGVPPKEDLHVTQELAENCLKNLADSLVPPPEVVENVDRAKFAIQQAIYAVFPGSMRLEFFGSSVNGFETKTSDIDCVVILDLDLGSALLGESVATLVAGTRRWRNKEKDIAKQAALVLENALRTNAEVVALGLRVVENIPNARVPILKLSSAEGVAIDVSFNNKLPIYNSKLLRSYAHHDMRVQRLGRLVKYWAKQRCVNDSRDGTLSSYGHILLVIHYLQHVGVVPNFQDRGLLAAKRHADVGETNRVDEVHDVWFIDPENPASHEAMERWSDRVTADALDSTLYGLLYGFFRYFAYEFAMNSKVVSIRHGIGKSSNAVDKLGYFSTEHEVSKHQFFCIDDPMEFGRQFGTSSLSGAVRLVNEFARACKLLSASPDAGGVKEVFSNSQAPSTTRTAAALRAASKGHTVAFRAAW